MTLTNSPRPIARPSLSEWPALADAPTGPRVAIASRVARAMFDAAVGRLDVSVDIDGRTVGRGGPTMTVHRPEEFFARIGRDGLIGFGEAYLTGAWDADDLGGFLTVLAAEMPRLVPRPLQRLRSAYVSRPPHGEDSSAANSRDNIAHHYDLSNDLFATFLDPTWCYSSALFEGETSLRDAQIRKLERLLDVTGVGPGSRVLEIGTGWGELAIRAARRGATVHTVTLSTQQQALAQERIRDAGVADQVCVDLCDYRHIPGAADYDVIVSVEMIEAVGHRYWLTYFETLSRLLAPGGRIGLQAITMPHDRMLATRHTWTWINKYVFPGGFLPSVEAIRSHAEDAGLTVAQDLAFGPSYARTLREWDQTFMAAREEVLDLGFDDIFIRLWHFYLEYSQAGFASGYLDVHQMVLFHDQTTGTARMEVGT